VTKITPMAKTVPTFQYPKPVDMRVGCKVSWLYYQTKAEAEAAAAVAKHEAKYKAGQGYGFGYMVPGEISKTGPRDKNSDLYEVCIP